MWIIKNLLVYAMLTALAWSGITLAYVGPVHVTADLLGALAGGVAFMVLVAAMGFGVPSLIAVAVLAPVRGRIAGEGFFLLAAPIMVLVAVPMLVAEPGFHAPLVVAVQLGVQVLSAVAMAILRPVGRADQRSRGIRSPTTPLTSLPGHGHG